MSRCGHDAREFRTIAKACEERAVLDDKAIVWVEVLVDGLLQERERRRWRAGYGERFGKVKRDVPV